MFNDGDDAPVAAAPVAALDAAGAVQAAEEEWDARGQDDQGHGEIY